MAAQKLEEQRKQQAERLATLRAELETLKAQKQDMVERLKQVPALTFLGTAERNMPGYSKCGADSTLSLALRYWSPPKWAAEEEHHTVIILLNDAQWAFAV